MDLIKKADKLLEEDKFQEAVAWYRKAMVLNPSDSEIYFKMGKSMLKQRFSEILPVSLACFQKALQINPDNHDVYEEMAKVFFLLGDNAKALDSINKTIKLDPHNIAAHFARLYFLCPNIYEKEDNIATARENYSRELSEMTRDNSLFKPTVVDLTIQAIGKYPFYLAYQAGNDCLLQKQYGQLACRIQATRYPQWSCPLKAASHHPRSPLRVGIVSAFFSKHSNWKMRIHGWLEKLDRKRFEIYGYYTGKRPDQYTDIARRECTRFVENDFSVDSLCRKIVADQLDVLIYPEIGMNKLVVELSALRLTPVQCTTWGHPTTSGLPTIDYFLSSDLMEPEDAEQHYSETLIRLPNLSVYYLPLPPSENSAEIGRADLHLNPKAKLYLCVQSLAKYLPQHDDIFPRIATQVKDCQFVFLARKTSRPQLSIFKRRLEQTFARHHLDYREYVVFLPYLNSEKYSALNRLGDIFLDSIGWSGCNSTLEAIAYNLPVVTLPDKMMRGRHTLAFLKMMGITETIADSIDNYINIAIRLGLDLQWRKQICSLTTQNKHKLYRDMESIRGLENFLETVVRGKPAFSKPK